MVTKIAVKNGVVSVRCYVCHGSGHHGSMYQWHCEACSGSGRLVLEQRNCDMCGGTGNDGPSGVSLAGCSSCTGFGKIFVDKFGKICR